MTFPPTTQTALIIIKSSFLIQGIHFLSIDLETLSFLVNFYWSIGDVTQMLMITSIYHVIKWAISLGP